MEKQDITIMIIVRDEADNLRFLLPTLEWARQVLVIGNHCTDDSREVTLQHDALWRETEETDFAAIRDQFLDEVTTEWLFYLDADERVNGDLYREIVNKLKNSAGISAYSILRKDYHYGTLMTHGGWDHDWVTRIFRKSTFQGWTGSIHESPQFEGRAEKLKSPLLHFTHRDTATNLAKSSRWTIKEAELLAASGLPPVTRRTILRKVVMEFYRRYWKNQGWRDGMAGFVEALVQAFNRGFVYIQVWELQQEPSLVEQYASLETAVNQSLKGENL